MARPQRGRKPARRGWLHGRRAGRVEERHRQGTRLRLPSPGCRALGLSIVALVGLTSRAAHAGELRASARTYGEAYAQSSAGDGGVVTRRRLVQTLGLGILDVLPPTQPGQLRRTPEEGQIRVVASMRLRHDFGTWLGGATGSTRDLVAHVDARQLDLMYGYVEGQRLWRWVDFRAGRQFEASGLDWYAFDGGWVRARTPTKLAVDAFAGFAVDGAALFGISTFEADGTRPTIHTRSPSYGAGVAVVDVPWLEARVGYRRQSSPSFLQGGLATSDARTRGGIDQELLSARTSLRFARGRVVPHAALRFDLGALRVSDFTVGVDLAISEHHLVRALIMRAVPLFDLDSIFSVFAIEPVEEGRLSLEIRANERWTLGARGQLRTFRASTTTEGTRPAAAISLGGGGGVSASRRGRHTALRFDGNSVGGEGGLRAGTSVDLRAWVLRERLALDGRVWAHTWRSETDARHAGWAAAIQAGVDLRLVRGVHLAFLTETITGTRVDVGFRALGVVAVDFTTRTGLR
jgi:hypothetical protein